MKVSKIDPLLRARLDDRLATVRVVVTFRTQGARDDAVDDIEGAVLMPPQSMAVTLTPSRVRALAADDAVLGVKLLETAELLG